MTNVIAPPDSLPGEEWRPVPGYEEAYAVSSFGRFLAIRRRGSKGGLRKTKVGKNGYPIVVLTQRDVSKTHAIHVLMAIAFLGPRPMDAVVRHLDGDRLNSRVDNIAWGTWSENTLDRVAHGRDPNARKTHCPQGHAYVEGNLYVRKAKPGRTCRTCAKARANARYAAIKVARA